MRRPQHVTSAIALLLLMAGPPLLPAAEWTETGFDGFRRGACLDAGSNLYVSHRGRIQIINRWDLNGDGFLDLVLPSGHAHTEKEDTYIYLNTGDDIDGRTRIKLAANGSRGGVFADFNQDGYADLAVCNGDNGITTYTDLYVYYGSADGFTVAKRVTLPAQNSSSIAAGDFDGDGWVDIAVACQWRAGDLVHPTGAAQSFVYWNSAKGFSAEARGAFSYDGAGAVAVAAGKITGGGGNDLIVMTGKKTLVYPATRKRFDGSAEHAELPYPARAAAVGDVNHDGRADVALCVGDEVVILRGAGTGTFEKTPVRLAAKSPRGVAMHDLNNDGYDDVAVANQAGADGAPWVASYVYFSDKGDFASARRVELPSMGASSVTAADLNGDGFADLVIGNERVTNQNSIPSCVYWNDRGEFTKGNHTELATQGCVGNAVGDVNHDGKPDVVFFNFEGNFRDGASKTTVFWGDGTRNYSKLRALEIDTHYVTSVAHADLDDDGYVDLVLTQSRFISGAGEDQFNSVIVLWGAKEGAFERSTRLSVDYMAGGVRIADLNRDGWLDLVVGATSTDPVDPKRKGVPIFWGSAKGFAQKNRTVVAPAGEYPRCPLVADVNRDGYPDLVNQAKYGSILTWWGGASGFDDGRVTEMKLGREDNLVFIDAADLNKDGWLDLILPCRQLGKDAEVSSFVYYGSEKGYSNDRREELPVNGPYEATVADLDKDGWLDVVLSSYKGNVKRNWPSAIYWGSAKGLRQRPRFDLPTFAASGVESADYDGDGWIDLFVSNHRVDGTSDGPGPHNHRGPSQLYWGGPQGYSRERCWTTVGNGPHAMNLRDVGNAYDRGLYEDYTSPAHEFEKGKPPVKIAWEAETPLGTKVSMQVRYAATKEGMEKSAWVGPNGEGSWYEGGKDGETLKVSEDARFVQYRARLVTPNGGATPYLKSVTMTFGE